MTTVNPQHRRLLEALLFASAGPVADSALSENLPEDADVPALLTDLAEEYSNRGVNLVKIGKGWGFRTAPDLASLLTIERVSKRRLSRAAIETLAIVAYHQPVTRTEIEEIRGVGLSKGTMDILFEAGWIRPRGRRRTPGRPVTWGTSEEFLDQFGLESLDELPGVEELKSTGLLDSQPPIEAPGKRRLIAQSVDVDEDLGDVEIFDTGEIDDSGNGDMSADSLDSPDSEPTLQANDP